MENIETLRKSLNKQQTQLRKVLTSYQQHDEAMELFFKQHAMLHSARMAQMEYWSFEDAILDDMTEEQIRRIPQNCEHSVAWSIWHLARIEDVAMNLLVAGRPQLFYEGDWLEPLGISAVDTGNAMSPEAISELSAAMDVEALRAYRAAVGRRTRENVSELRPEQLKQKVDPARLQRVMDEGAVIEAARGLIDYWGNRNLAGLLLMPATRHNLVHLNEAYKLKKRRR